MGLHQDKNLAIFRLKFWEMTQYLMCMIKTDAGLKRLKNNNNNTFSELVFVTQTFMCNGFFIKVHLRVNC